MLEIVVLDSGPLGLASHPRPVAEILTWMTALLAAGVKLLVPEIADYEVRRELLRAKKSQGVLRLDEMKVTLGFVPITTDAMLRAAELWAEARRRGKPTAADASLDADVILAGQVLALNNQNVVVASTNPKHLSRFVPAEDWRGIQP